MIAPFRSPGLTEAAPVLLNRNAIAVLLQLGMNRERTVKRSGHNTGVAEILANARVTALDPRVSIRVPVIAMMNGDRQPCAELARPFCLLRRYIDADDRTAVFFSSEPGEGPESAADVQSWI